MTKWHKMWPLTVFLLFHAAIFISRPIDNLMFLSENYIFISSKWS